MARNVKATVDHAAEDERAREWEAHQHAMRSHDDEEPACTIADGVMPCGRDVCVCCDTIGGAV